MEEIMLLQEAAQKHEMEPKEQFRAWFWPWSGSEIMRGPSGPAALPLQLAANAMSLMPTMFCATLWWGLGTLSWGVAELGDTLLSSQELFKKVLPHQCLGSVWTKRAKSGKKHIPATITQFNHVATCVITTCLGDPGQNQSGGGLE
ncbi:hypothetical protein QTO34_006397 [Cnephaeus nilssonii]|uniref:Ras-GEF domain-containing protein n=1 Tax=Cnephaeus nilssonii TaxID=3371016 RepID=A0AA40LGN5_CNENI|nr:hypothetical protein QTO34_006397 [Eptesicus nilssonii]